LAPVIKTVLFAMFIRFPCELIYRVSNSDALQLDG
jgi:hypothetical protein